MFDHGLLSPMSNTINSNTLCHDIIIELIDLGLFDYELIMLKFWRLNDVQRTFLILLISLFIYIICTMLFLFLIYRYYNYYQIPIYHYFILIFIKIMPDLYYSFKWKRLLFSQLCFYGFKWRFDIPINYLLLFFELLHYTPEYDFFFYK